MGDGAGDGGEGDRRGGRSSKVCWAGGRRAGGGPLVLRAGAGVERGPEPA